jgi:hypothetical protein
MNRYENYVREQFKKLKDTDVGFSIKIFDGLGNTTNQMELTPQKAKLILKILNEKRGINES